MPLIRTREAYEHLKSNILKAKKLKERGLRYKDIARELNVSLPMAFNYVKNGDRMLAKYKIKDDYPEEWEIMFDLLVSFRELFGNRAFFKQVNKLSLRTNAPRKFRRFVMEKLEESKLL